jgi:Domain of Unknown Function (DUF748)
MRRITPRVKRVLIITTSIILLCIALVIMFISPITKYLLEKNDVKWIGRELTMDWAYVNPFTGYIHLSNLKVFEEKGDSIFLSMKGLSVNLSVHKLLSESIEITQLTIDRPWGQIVQRKKQLNITDLINRFTTKGVDPSGTSSSWRTTILNSQIIDGEFHYRELMIPISYFIKKVNIETSGKEADIDTVAATFRFEEGKSRGSVKGNVTINVKDLDYKVFMSVHDFDLEIIRQYIWELINYGMFRAHLDATVHAVGNFNSRDSISIKGRIALRDFHLGKTTTDDYMSFKRLSFAIEEVSPIRKKFLFDSVTLVSPYLKYERYDSLDNIQTLFGKKGQNITDVTQQPDKFNLVIEIARYIKIISRNFFRSDYRIGTLRVSEGDLIFNDFSLAEKFSVRASPLTISADSINSDRSRVGFTFASGLKPYGEGKIYVSINPKDSGDFDMKYAIEKLPASLFNPYLISYTSFPLDRGTLEINGLWNVRNSEVKSSNHLIVIDPRVSKRVRNKDMKWIPMPLIMAFIRERGNVIDYEIPISGNLKNPNFHLRDVVFDVIKNIFVKPPTTPYRLEVKNIETEIEKLQTIKWELRQHSLRPHQQKFVKQIARFLKDNPEALLNVRQMVYDSKEKEYLLFFEAKKKYFLLSRSKSEKEFTEDDSLTVSKMSAKDPGLVAHISKNLSDTVMFTLQEKCVNFVGNEVVNMRLKKLLIEREKSFRELFLKNGTASRVKLYAHENSIPYNGFSYFKLEYPGEIPPALQKAYQKMNNLNKEMPRKKYRAQRKKEAALLRSAEKL